MYSLNETQAAKSGSETIIQQPSTSAKDDYLSSHTDVTSLSRSSSTLSSSLAPSSPLHPYPPSMVFSDFGSSPPQYYEIIRSYSEPTRRPQIQRVPTIRPSCHTQHQKVNIFTHCVPILL